MSKAIPAHTKETLLWENILGAVGALMLLGIVAFLFWEALQPSTPPNVTVVTESTRPVANGYLVRIRAHNQGTSTAATVEIEGTLRSPDDPNAAPIEVSSLTFDYVPAHSIRTGGLFFRADPNQYHLEVKALGYVDP